MPQIADIGARFFSMIVDAGFYIIMIASTVDFFKCAVKGDFEGAIKAVLMSGAMYAGLKFIPIVMNMVKGAF